MEIQVSSNGSENSCIMNEFDNLEGGCLAIVLAIILGFGILVLFVSTCQPS